MTITFKVNQHQKFQVISLKGKLLHDADMVMLQKELSAVLDQKKQHIIYDLEHLEQMNSTGLNFIIRSLTKTRINGGELCLCKAQGNVATLLAISKMNEVVTVYGNLEEAIHHLN
jgi:anti-sigma B factor antagonist